MCQLIGLLSGVAGLMVGLWIGFWGGRWLELRRLNETIYRQYPELRSH